MSTNRALSPLQLLSKYSDQDRNLFQMETWANNGNLDESSNRLKQSTATIIR